MTETPMPPRPKRTDPAVQKKALDLLMPEVVQWMKQQGPYSDDEEPDVREALESAVMGNVDGYEIARELDRDYGWDVDARLVDIVDEHHWNVEKVHRGAVVEWVWATGVALAQKEGDRVVFWCQSPKRVRDEQTVGVVRGLHVQTGQYTIGVVEHGHLPDGQSLGGTLGYVIDAEKVIGPAPADASAQATP